MMYGRELLAKSAWRLSCSSGLVVACSILLLAAGALAEDTGHRHPMGGHSMGHEHMGQGMGEAGQAHVSGAFRSSLGPVYREYFGLHQALSADDLSGAKSAFAKVGQTLAAVDMKLLAGDDRGLWMEKAALVRREVTAGARAKDLAEARQRFAVLSEAIIAVDRQFGHPGGGEHFVVFCAMALNGKGASWLQALADVSNPYFAREMEMRRCGEVREKLL